MTVARVDLASADGIAAFVRSGGDRVDILVNNVGGSAPRPEGFATVSDEEWIASRTINLLATVRTTRAILLGMLAAGRGSIVNIGSANAFLPDPGIIDYGAAKAGLLNFAKALSKEVGPHDVRINTVNPGPTATARWRPDQIDEVARRMVTGRLTRPEEIADVAVLLASDRTSNVTGATWAVDDGVVPTLPTAHELRDHAGARLTHGRARVNGIQLHYAVGGSGDPVYLVHGHRKRCSSGVGSSRG